MNRLHRGSSLFGDFFISSCNAVTDAVAQNFVCFYKTKKFTLFKAKATKTYLNLLIVGGKGTGFQIPREKKNMTISELGVNASYFELFSQHAKISRNDSSTQFHFFRNNQCWGSRFRSACFLY